MTSRRAAIYLRISRDDQATGLAVERQREDCLAIIAARGWELAEEYVDNAVSASKRATKRPNYDRMVADYHSGAFDAVVCYDLDRLTRQPRQLEDWIDAAQDRGLVLVTANGEADLATDNGRLFARIKASVARAEIERKGARQLRANLQRAESGKPIPGRRRYGYETDGLTPRPAEASIVRRMFQHVAEGGSLRSITLALQAEGVDPAPGKEWSTRRVRDILMNPHYAGAIRHRGQTIASEHVEPLVDTELAAEVRAILADPSRKTTPGSTPRHLLSNIAVCGVCGEPLVFMRAYRCRATPRHPSILEHFLDNRVRDEVAKAFLSGGPDLFAPASSSTVSALVAQHERNAAAVDAILADRDEGLVPAPVARSRLIELKSAREAIEAELERARSEKSAGSALAEIARELLGDSVEWSMRDYAEKKAAVLEGFDALDLDRRRELVRGLLHIEVSPGRDNVRRVWIEHKVAPHLNPDAVDPAILDELDGNAA